MTQESSVPPCPVLDEAFGAVLRSADPRKSVTVNVGVLKLLISTALAAEDFDDGAYLSGNPDLEAAWRSGAIKDLREHYIGIGFFEGRKSGSQLFDEAWYLGRNPDIAEAVNSGHVKSARDHFDKTGYREWRAPNERYAKRKQAWREAFGDMRRGG